MRAFHLWIDGIGGYLVCLDNRVTLGRSTPEAAVDVPLLADVSRLHAHVLRDSEGYLLEALRPAQVNGKAVDKALLRDKDRVTLGSSCQLQFRQPVPISASARLDLVDGLRLKLAVDGVLLMADTLVLGPGEQSHVSMPDLKKPVILYRQKAGLGVRADGPLTIDGQAVATRVLLGPNAHIVGEEFSLTLEAVGS
ncbi:MAG TPA: FHA domain-containing protein [Gemmataceae bacterium]|nr:FHA domain-containing protein [Gemmataceae bacterium]